MSMKKNLYSMLVTVLAIALLVGAFLMNRPGEPEDPTPVPLPIEDPVNNTDPAPIEEPDPEVDPDPVEDPSSNTDPAADPAAAEIEIYEDGIYDTKDEVAFYIYTFHKLPSNYMTKKEARKHGWENGALNRVIKGMCIGGDYYGNYEGVLPEGYEYHECDIDTIKKKGRGEKRIVYSDTWDIYYTEDHYETFELLYGGEE